MVSDFCSCFCPDETRKLLHKMMRSAFAQTKLLDKKDVLDLLFLKEELEKLLAAAAILAKDKTNKPLLGKFFRNKPVGEWIEGLDELFHAALYGGFFINTPNDEDVYHSCRRLFKIVKTCFFIYEREGNVVV